MKLIYHFHAGGTILNSMSQAREKWTQLFCVELTFKRY